MSGDQLHQEALINFETVLEQAIRAFEAQNFDGASRRLDAAKAVIERVKSRKERAA